MPKIKIKMRLQGFELDIEGERQDVANATQSTTNQLSSLISPSSQFLSEDQQGSRDIIDVTPDGIPSGRKGARKKSASGSRVLPKKSSEAIDFVNDPSRFGTPLQSWSLTQKAIWTLFVVQELQALASMSAGMIANTFNKHFRQSGQIRPSNVSRDLGKVKTKSGDAFPLVGEDPTKSPAEWYLVDEGTRHVRKLISDTMGGS